MRTLLIMLAGTLVATANGADFTNIYGRVFTNAKVTRIEPDGLSLTHAGGITKVFFSELTADIQAKYSYDPNAAAAHAREAQLAQQRFIQAQTKSSPQSVSGSDNSALRVINIVGMIDKIIKPISGLTGNFSDSFGHVFSRPVRGGKFRVVFDIRNASPQDIIATVYYGDYFKSVFIPAGKTREREEISGPEKYYEIFVEVNGSKKGYSFNW